MNFNSVLCNFEFPKPHTNKQSSFYKINLGKNNSKKYLLTKETSTFTSVKGFLRFKCILSTFHDEFSVLKNIGKGSFAKVLTNFSFHG